MSSVVFVPWAFVIGVQGTTAPVPLLEDDPDNTATIKGVVTRIGTGEPIVRASLFLEPVIDPTDIDAAINALAAREQAPGGTTDSEGNFRIEGIEPGEYRLNVYRNGFVHQVYGQRDGVGAGTRFDLVAGQEFEASFEMIPAGDLPPIMRPPAG